MRPYFFAADLQDESVVHYVPKVGVGRVISCILLCASLLITGCQGGELPEADDGSGTDDGGTTPDPTPPAGGGSMPATPSLLSADALSTDEVRVTWNISGGAPQRFELERSADNASWLMIANIDGNTNQFDDRGLNSATSYWYRVGAVNGKKRSAFSNPLSVQTAAEPAGNMTYPNGSPWMLPVRVEAEHYDQGGAGVAYADLSRANEGMQYRTMDAVDLETTTDTGGGYNVGFLAAGEWLAYTVQVPASGEYDLTFRIASQSKSGAFYLEVDGNNVTGTVAVPVTGGWQMWQNVVVSRVMLKKGRHVLRWVVARDGFNFNYIDFKPAVATRLPAAPTQLMAKPDATGKHVALQWQDASRDESGFILQRKVDAGEWALLAALPANSIQYNDMLVSKGRHYAYRVQAVNVVGESPFTTAAELDFTGEPPTDVPPPPNPDGGGTPPPPPPPPPPAGPSGAELYTQQCASCHGADGLGGITKIPMKACDACGNLNTLTNVIDRTMPPGKTAQCDAVCSGKLAQYIVDTFNAGSKTVGSSSVNVMLSHQHDEGGYMPRRVYLLSGDDYTRTVHALLGSDAPVNLGNDERAYYAEYQQHAVRLANWAVYQRESSVWRCEPRENLNCATQWLQQWAKRILHHSLSAQALADELRAFTSLRHTENQAAAARILMRWLSADDFLYRREVGVLENDRVYRLTPSEVAVVMAYEFWGVAPDEALIDAAEHGNLARLEDYEQQLARLWQSQPMLARSPQVCGALSPMFALAQTPDEQWLWAKVCVQQAGFVRRVAEFD